MPPFSLIVLLCYCSDAKSCLMATPWPAALQVSLCPRACSNSCPSSQWCHPTISSSAAPSPSALSFSQHQDIFQWVGCHIRCLTWENIVIFTIVLLILILNVFKIIIFKWININIFSVLIPSTLNITDIAHKNVFWLPNKF